MVQMRGFQTFNLQAGGLFPVHSKSCHFQDLSVIFLFQFLIFLIFFAWFAKYSFTCVKFNFISYFC